MKFKRFTAMCLAGIMMVGAMTGCGSSSNGASAAKDSDITIGYINLADTDVFCMTLEKSFVASAEKKGWSVECVDGNNDAQKQIDQTNSFISKGVDAIVLVPSDSTACVPAVEAANNAGVPITCLAANISSDADLDWTFVGAYHIQSGADEGDYMAKVLPENASICYLAGTAGIEHASLRRQGTMEALEAARDDIKVLDDQDGDYVKDEGLRITQAWIQKYSDGKGGVTFDGIIAANDQMALGAIEALKSAQIPVGTGDGEVKVCGIDGSDDGIVAVEEGTMALTVLQDAPGEASALANVIESILAGDEVDNEILVNYIPVTADNVAEYKDHNKVS